MRALELFMRENVYVCVWVRLESPFGEIWARYKFSHYFIIIIMQKDATMNSLMKIILQGWPEEKKLLTLQCQDYFPYREELAINNGLVFKGHRVIVPER